MEKQHNFHIRQAVPADYNAIRNLWNKSSEAGEVVYSPLNNVAEKLVVPGSVMLVAESDTGILGFVHGVAASEGSVDNAYLTVIFVDCPSRRLGIGSALLSALEAHMSALGRKMLVCSGNNPVHLEWKIPNTPGHDHNNAPGADKECVGYPFLIARGMNPGYHEVAMYMNLAEYKWPEKMDEIQARLLAEGIWTGIYEGGKELEFDGMCDRVGSDYWRNVLRTELAAWKAGAPNADATLWVDGKPPKGPRPLLLAVHENHIVGFTGPVDKQQSGRGWFTGICVDPNYEKRSIGSLLFNMLMREFVRDGAVFSSLFTGAENHAQQIYLRAGFSVARGFAVITKALSENAAYGDVHF